MSLPEPLGTSPGSRSTTSGSTGRSGGSARGARRGTRSDPTGRLTARSVARGSTSVTAEPSSPGGIASSLTGPSVTL
ncbi:hypothetical protein MLD38_015137 [Melastoma candidum]|uniref:Uncharacterized protein n=1 Tax=Melastoma candidum TaxID=119954 RepID=A0ACB9RF63_9MYRT|nr:hypothetical protein MLD38_015137 [Melastoma candidum]